jgi:hypothetical protein
MFARTNLRRQARDQPLEFRVPRWLIRASASSPTLGARFVRARFVRA